VNTEGGPFLLADARAIKAWSGCDSDDYERLCCALSAAPPSWGTGWQLDDYDATFWEPEGPGPRVLCTEEGDPVTEGSVNECMETVLRRAGIGRSRKVHILRHTFCSHLAMQSAPAKAIQELAGHTDLTTTMRYMHLAPGSLRAAVNLLEGRPSEPQAGNMQETATPKKPSTA